MLFGRILRSPHAHTKIVALNTSMTERLPWVKAILTGKDVLKMTKPYAALAERAEIGFIQISIRLIE